MLFTLFIAVLAATLWALHSFLSGRAAPHDPSTLELAAMAAVTMGTYAWMKRLRSIRRQTAVLTIQTADEEPTPVPVRYAEAKVEVEREETLESAGRVA